MLEGRDYSVRDWSAEERRLDVAIDPASPYFEGHFPGRPLLPAVAQVALLQVLLERLHGDIAIWRLERVRFLAAVLPGERIVLRMLQSSGQGRARFEIGRGADKVSDGIVCWGPRVR